MRCFRVPVVLAALVVVSFSSALLPDDGDPWKSETFLTDYSGLVPVPARTGQNFVYEAPGAEAKFGHFDAVMVDQPEISLSPSSPYHSAKPDELKAIAEFLRSAVAESLRSRGYEVVDRQGEHVLYLRVALTDLQLKKKRRGVLSYTPIGAVVHGVKAAVQDVMKEVDILDMAGQAEALDSRSGDVLAAIVCKRRAPVGASGGKLDRMTFEEFHAHVTGYGHQMACRLDNGRLPVDQRVDCTDPAVPFPAPR
jgi:hypothetical protein